MRITIIEERNFEKIYEAGSITGNLVEIIGERLVEDLESGKRFAQYLYNIVGYEAKNGLPFAARKCNIVCFEKIKEERIFEEA